MNSSEIYNSSLPCYHLPGRAALVPQDHDCFEKSNMLRVRSNNIRRWTIFPFPFTF